jgi:aspartyl-tRNA(Asn)/glutamyl-tRNA(Gln) amidotransferase subunit C
MMKIDKDKISKTAILARLDLSDEEKDEFSRQISEIIGYVEKINELQTEKIAPADHIGGLTNVFRKDEIAVSIDIKEIEKIAPRFEDGHFIVPRIIEGS